jgi:hypothetical protein
MYADEAVPYHLRECFLFDCGLFDEARGSVVGWGTMYATSRKVAGSSPDEVDIFTLPNPSSHTMALGSTAFHRDSFLF